MVYPWKQQWSFQFVASLCSFTGFNTLSHVFIIWLHLQTCELGGEMKRSTVQRSKQRLCEVHGHNPRFLRNRLMTAEGRISFESWFLLNHRTVCGCFYQLGYGCPSPPPRFYFHVKLVSSTLQKPSACVPDQHFSGWLGTVEGAPQNGPPRLIAATFPREQWRLRNTCWLFQWGHSLYAWATRWHGSLFRALRREIKKSPGRFHRYGTSAWLVQAGGVGFLSAAVLHAALHPGPGTRRPLSRPLAVCWRAWRPHVHPSDSSRRKRHSYPEIDVALNFPDSFFPSVI